MFRNLVCRWSITRLAGVDFPEYISLKSAAGSGIASSLHLHLGSLYMGSSAQRHLSIARIPLIKETILPSLLAADLTRLFVVLTCQAVEANPGSSAFLPLRCAIVGFEHAD